jgi:hypothetical protein
MTDMLAPLQQLAGDLQAGSAGCTDNTKCSCHGRLGRSYQTGWTVGNPGLQRPSPHDYKALEEGCLVDYDSDFLEDRMTAKNYARLAALIFAIVAVLQLARAVSGLAVTVGTTISIPLWASWIACIVAAGLAWLGFDASRA